MREPVELLGIDLEGVAELTLESLLKLVEYPQRGLVAQRSIVRFDQLGRTVRVPKRVASTARVGVDDGDDYVWCGHAQMSFTRAEPGRLGSIAVWSAPSIAGHVRRNTSQTV